MRIAIIARRPDIAHQCLIGRAGVGDDARGVVGGEGAGALVGIGAEIALTRGQGAQRFGDGGDGCGLVNIADNADLDRAIRQPVADHSLQLVEG